MAETQAQQLLHKLAHAKTVQKTPSVTEVKLKRCPQLLKCYKIVKNQALQPKYLMN